jgi:hypothetical protein
MTVHSFTYPFLIHIFSLLSPCFSYFPYPYNLLYVGFVQVEESTYFNPTLVLLL